LLMLHFFNSVCSLFKKTLAFLFCLVFKELVCLADKNLLYALVINSSIVF